MKFYKIMIFLITTISSFSLYADDVTQIGRYTTIQNKPTAAQVNPLLAVSQFHFQANVKTVGDAIGIVLNDTGYQLTESNRLSNEVKEVLTKSLPITNRQIGPLEIKDILVVLMGKDVFILTVDPLHRIVNFEVKKSMANLLGVPHGNHTKKYRA